MADFLGGRGMSSRQGASETITEALNSHTFDRKLAQAATPKPRTWLSIVMALFDPSITHSIASKARCYG